MQNNFILDTNFICSLVDESDVNHIKALELYRTLPLSQINFFIPAVVLIELGCYLLDRGKGVAPTLQFVAELDFQLIAQDQKFLNSFIDFCKIKKLKIKPIDATVLFCSSMIKAKILTFDKKLIKFYKQVT